MKAFTSRYSERLLRLTLKLAVDCDLASGLTAPILSKAAGLSAAAASDKLSEFMQAGFLDQSIASHSLDRRAYFITDAGQQWLQGDAKEQPSQQTGFDFGPLLTCWGHLPKIQFA